MNNPEPYIVLYQNLYYLCFKRYCEKNRFFPDFRILLLGWATAIQEIFYGNWSADESWCLSNVTQILFPTVNAVSRIIYLPDYQIYNENLNIDEDFVSVVKNIKTHILLSTCHSMNCKTKLPYTIYSITHFSVLIILSLSYTIHHICNLENIWSAYGSMLETWTWMYVSGLNWINLIITLNIDLIQNCEMINWVVKFLKRWNQEIHDSEFKTWNKFWFNHFFKLKMCLRRSTMLPGIVKPLNSSIHEKQSLSDRGRTVAGEATTTTATMTQILARPLSLINWALTL